MDGHGQRDQHGRPIQQGANYGQGFRSNIGSSTGDRYGLQAQAQIPPGPSYGSTQSTPEQRPGSAHYGYAQNQPQFAAQLQGNPMQFPSDFVPDAARNQQYQSFMPSMMSYMPQQTPSSYDPMQAYSARQSAAVGADPREYGVAQYYGNTRQQSGAGPATPSYATSSFQQPGMHYQTPTQSNRRTSNPPSYGPGVSEYAPFDVSSLAAAQQQQQTQQPESRRTNDGYPEYLDNLRQTFQLVQQGRLVEAAERLMQISDWLLTHVEDLGKPYLEIAFSQC